MDVSEDLMTNIVSGSDNGIEGTLDNNCDNVKDWAAPYRKENRSNVSRMNYHGTVNDTKAQTLGDSDERKEVGVTK